MPSCRSCRSQPFSTLVEMQRIAILGATGSIGTSTLDVIARHPDRFVAHALAAHTSVEAMRQLCRRFNPSQVCMADPLAAKELAHQIKIDGLAVQVLSGPEGLIEIAAAPGIDAVVAAIVGAVGLPSSIAAARAGKRILLANKEALVMAGRIFMQAVEDAGARLLPVDSEHNAIFQCMPAGKGTAETKGIRRIVLTASGGPFRNRKSAELAGVTPEQACAHPNWSMGPKISVDSATMMNKALEVIEARWLFDVDPKKIEVLIHPQSIVHSLVDYEDGSMIAQLGNPDMRTPIAQALAFPERITSGVAPLDLAALGRLDFQRPDFEAFPGLRLSYQVLEAGGTAATILNAANEVAVTAFLDRRLPFVAIAGVIEETLSRAEIHPAVSLEAILQSDLEARKIAASLVK